MLRSQPIRMIVEDQANKTEIDRNIPLRLDARLARYALLAGAAIASTRSASAGVITTVLPSPVDLAANAPYEIGFNGKNGSNIVFYTGATVFSTLTLRIAGLTGVGEPNYFFIGGHGGSTNVAFDYSAGDVIGNTGDVTPGNALPVAYPTSPLYGFITLDDFTAPGVGYIGVDAQENVFVTSISMFVSSNVFGFLELNGGSLVGFAYESDPNTPITVFDVTAPAPEPGSFGLLALGAAGLAALRKRKNRV